MNRGETLWLFFNDNYNEDKDFYLKFKILIASTEYVVIIINALKSFCFYLFIYVISMLSFPN